MKKVKPIFTQTVALPLDIKIPITVAVNSEWPRTFRLTHGQEIPAGVVEWMLQDPRYRSWFANDPLAGIKADEDNIHAPVAPVATEAISDQVEDVAVHKNSKARSKV